MNRDELQPGEQICSDDEVAAIRDELEEYCDEAEGLRMIRHPLITYTGYDGSKDTVMMLGRWLDQKHTMIDKAVEDRDWALMLMLHEKPWRLDALIQYGPYMSDEEFFKELGTTWCQIENQWQYQDRLPSLFSPKDRSLDARTSLMDEEERSALEVMSNSVIIFRGCVADRGEGWSWSLDREEAEWFAQRYVCDGNSGLLLIGQCRKADVIAYFSRCGEEEIVINSDHVKIIESVVIGEDSVTPLVGTGEADDD